MSKFTKRITRTYKFDGDVLTVEMDRLKRKDALSIMPHLPKMEDDGETLKMDQKQQAKLMEVSGDILQKYLVTIIGLTMDDKPVTSEEAIILLFDQSYFMELQSDILSDLFTASFNSEDKEKKLKRK